MPGTTTNYAFEYPVDADVPNGPAQIKALAEELDAVQWQSRSLKPTVGTVAQTTSDLVTEAGAKEVPGLKVELTPAVASNLLVMAAVLIESEAGSQATVAVYVDGVSTMTFPNVRDNNASKAWIPTLLVAPIALTAALHTIMIKASAPAYPGLKISGGRLSYALLAS